MQGRANNNQPQMKQEPRGQTLNPGGVSQIGIALGVQREIDPMYQGKVGPYAPPTQNVSHPSGSQGKHR